MLNEAMKLYIDKDERHSLVALEEANQDTVFYLVRKMADDLKVWHKYLLTVELDGSDYIASCAGTHAEEADRLRQQIWDTVFVGARRIKPTSSAPSMIRKTPEYVLALKEFQERLESDLQKKAATGVRIGVTHDPGRQYDQIPIIRRGAGSNFHHSEVRYFVDQRDGAVLGTLAEAAELQAVLRDDLQSAMVGLVRLLSQVL
jgi:hypothetical protein